MKKVIPLSTDSTLKDASEVFAPYGFRALPVTDQNGTLLGIVLYRDVMNLKHHWSNGWSTALNVDSGRAWGTQIKQGETGDLARIVGCTRTALMGGSLDVEATRIS